MTESKNSSDETPKPTERLRVIQAVDISKGIRFECQPNCGACCRKPGKVGLRAGELETVEDKAAEIGIALEIEPSPYNSSVHYINAPDGCPLLDVETAQCLLGDDRPFQCRTFPFWPTILRDQEYFEQTKELCPGIGQGKRYRPAEIVAIVRGKRDGT